MSAELKWLTEKEEWYDLDEYLLFLRHKKAYEFAGGFCEGKSVLDYGCGGGYGAAVLAGYARKVVGVDIDADALEHAKQHYRSPNLGYEKIPADAPLPLERESFDVVVSFQVIEHVPDVPRYLSDLQAVLKDTGMILLTTPNRRHRLLPFQKPWNPEHLREYSAAQLERELSPLFEKVLVMGVHGSGEVVAIEHQRVRQRPFDVYVRRPLARTLRAILPGSVVSALRASPPPPAVDEQPLGPVDLQGFGMGDFCVAGNAEDGLDLLAICEKGGS
jgi:SAM-dependent methyltransferase